MLFKHTNMQLVVSIELSKEAKPKYKSMHEVSSVLFLQYN